MTRTIHTDTETTGLPVPGAPADDTRHPHLASLSGFLDETEDTIMDEVSTLVQPLPGVRYEDFPEAFRVHGITTERAQKEGMPLQLALERYVTLATCADTFSAFNALHFDFKILKIACARIPTGAALREQLERLQSVCTMESAANHLIGRKRISLKNAYFEMFKEETQTEQHHGSHKDALASRRIYWELSRRGALVAPVPTARVWETAKPEKNAAGEYAVAPMGTKATPKPMRTESPKAAAPSKNGKPGALSGW